MFNANTNVDPNANIKCERALKTDITWNSYLCLTGQRSEYFLLHRNKRLITNVTASLTTYSPAACVLHCLVTDSCLAITMLGNPKRCDLTSGVINTESLVGDNSSDVYVLGWYPWLPKHRIFFSHKKWTKKLICW